MALPPPPAALLPAASMGRGGSRAVPAAAALPWHVQPDEVWEYVFSFLPAGSDRSAAAAFCRYWLRAERHAAPAAAALPWHVLPDEVWEHLSSFLPADSDRGAAAATCRSWPRAERHTRRRPSLTNSYAASPQDAVDPVPAVRVLGQKRLSAESQDCQMKHWQIERKIKCKEMKSLDPADKVSCGGEANSGSGCISLVPACKKTSKGQVLFPYDEFLKLYNRMDLDFVPCGLKNCGNSCFANVVLQCLSCTRPLAAYLLGKDHSRECSMRNEKWCFLCELECHICKASESLHPFAPTKILSHLPSIGGNLGFGRQEDAHEFLRFAIDKMQSACLHEYEGEKAVDLSTQETTIIQHIFGGQLQSQVQCNGCGMVSNRYDNMMDLTVEIQGDAESLEKCLDQFTAIEWLVGDNKYKCDGCNDYKEAQKQLSVHQAPNILTVTLKRFQSGRFGKLNKRVTFPMELDLTPYMSCTDGSDLYDLYAVVVHLDMLNASFIGHYICYIKGYQGRWYKIDDCKVMVVDEDEVHAQGAYMLLYSRRTPHPRPFVTSDESVKQQQQHNLLSSNGPGHMILADETLNCESSLKTNSSLLSTGPSELTGSSREIKLPASTDCATFSELCCPSISTQHRGAAAKLDSKLQKKHYQPKVCWKKENNPNNTREHDYEQVNQIFVDVGGSSLSMQVNMRKTTARKLVGLALQRKGIRYSDVYLIYSGKILDDAADLGLLHISKDAHFVIVPRVRAGQDFLLTHARSFVDFVREMKPFYRVKIPPVLRHTNHKGIDVSIVFLSQSARHLLHMMIVCISRLHSEGKSLAGKFEYTDFIFWIGNAIIHKESWDDATKVNIILDFRKLSKIIDWLFRRPQLQPALPDCTMIPDQPAILACPYSAGPVGPTKPDDELPAYLDGLISLLRVFVHLGDTSALRAYASNHPSLLSFRERIRKTLETEVFYTFLVNPMKVAFRNAIGVLQDWAFNIVGVTPIYEAYMFGSSNNGVTNFRGDEALQYIAVSRNFFNHPNEKSRGSKRSSIPVGFTEEQAEAAFTLYCRKLDELSLRIVTKFEFTPEFDGKLLCGNEMADANARGGKCGGEDFSV